MAALFLFGAGASAHSGDCHPRCPPLGPDLFAELSKLGGVAAAINPNLAAKFSDDFEDGMAEFERRYPNDTPALLREMAAYFTQFRPLPGNHYRALFAGLITLPHPSVLATLNYDLLIERALNSEGYGAVYDPSTLTAADAGVPYMQLLKLHGSCHFLPDFHGILKGVKIIRSGSSNGTIYEGDYYVSRVMDEVRDFCLRTDAMAPAIALYAKGKRVLHSPGLVLGQQERWATAAETADHIFVIGVRVNEEDSHVWGPLRLSKAPISFVDPKPGPFLDWAKRVGRDNVSRLAGTFEEAVPLIVKQLS